MKLISFILPCYNEEGNVEEVYRQINAVVEGLPYQFEFVFIDNDSQDTTARVLRHLAAQDKRVKVIINSRNFGALRSSYHALFRARGAAVITIVTDLQDPPELIRDFLAKWEQGYKVVAGVIKGRKEALVMRSVRNFYYRLLSRLSNTKLIPNFTGYCLLDRQVVDEMRRIQDPIPYFRGIIAEVGFDTALVDYIQPKRRRGKTTTNFFYLYDLAMLGITNYSKVPLRLATMVGFLTAALSLLVAIAYLVYKLVFWSSFTLGMAPLVIGFFLFSSLQLIFLGLMGEYVGAIHVNVQRRPLVFEKETINFDETAQGGANKAGA